MPAADNLQTATWLSRADEGPSCLRVRRVRIEIVRGGDTGRSETLDQTSIRIGSRPECDVVVRDDTVSGVHCEIRLEERGFRLRDLGSTNGTFIARRRVLDSFLLPGDFIDVGRTRLRFEPLSSTVDVPIASVERFGGMVGRSLAMRELFARLERVAPTDATVLVTGPTGVGKELVAEAVHDASPRKDGPFVVVDCASLPSNLVESELFGHERGAFTGAMSSHVGAFERAHRGTLFLDELGELPLDLQPKLLRALEQRAIRRVGGARTIPVDIRIVAATHRDLLTEVSQGRFRADLYYRLAVAPVCVVPLAERREDIPLLVAHFLAAMKGAAQDAIGPEAMARLQAYDWPGNVRELRNTVERIIYLQEPTSTLLPDASPPTPNDEGERRAVDLAIPFKIAKQRLVEQFERSYVGALLDAHDGNISAAARVAGIDRMSIHKILNRLGMSSRG